MKKAEKQFNGIKEKMFLLKMYEWMQTNHERILAGAADGVQADVIPREGLAQLLVDHQAPVDAASIENFLEVIDAEKTGLISAAQLRSDKYIPKAFTRAAYEKEAKAGKKAKRKQKKKKKKKKPKLKLPKGTKISICCTEDQTQAMTFADSPYIPRHIFSGKETVFMHAGAPATPFSDDSIWIMDGIRMDIAHISGLCQEGDFDSVVRACQKGFDVNQCDALYKTPLMYSASAGRWDMVQLLLAYGYFCWLQPLSIICRKMVKLAGTVPQKTQFQAWSCWWLHLSKKPNPNNCSKRT